jgi:hypothetical protein
MSLGTIGTIGATLGILLATAVSAQTADEYRVKAAFLFNFAKFVEWPAQAFKNPADPIAICVVGKNPFGGALVQAVNGQAAQGKSFTILQISEASQMRFCHILFVSSSERKRLAPIFEEIKNGAVLTVGESDNFTAEGGMVNFRIEEGSVHLQINLDAAAQQRLHISSKLLSLAEIVRKGAP